MVPRCSTGRVSSTCRPTHKPSFEMGRESGSGNARWVTYTHFTPVCYCQGGGGRLLYGRTAEGFYSFDSRPSPHP